MAEEKSFEVRVKRWLEEQGIYPLGTARDKMRVPPIGYYEKRWGGGFSKAGLPDMHLVINGISMDVELKASRGRPSELQQHNIRQINEAGSLGVILYPTGFDAFQELVKGVMTCKLAIPVLAALKAAHTSTSCDTLTASERSHRTTQRMR